MNQKQVKQQIKRLLSFIAPQAASNWQEVRHRRHIHRFEQRMGLPELTQAFITQHGQSVLGGPFAGMTYVPQATGSALMPKLVGSYEAELHAVIEQIVATDYSVIIDIGCAEGYYANGLAMRLPSALIYAFDINPEAQALCKEMARLNGVQQQVKVLGACRHDDLNVLMTPRSLIVCDCEGYEAKLLQPAFVPALARADILVELHDQVHPGLTSLILDRFRETHNALMLTALERHAEDYPPLRFSEPEKRQIAVSEFRSANQQWAFLQAKFIGNPK
jgi:hypothetical protein